MKNKATNRIVSLILALMLIVGQASVVIATDEPDVGAPEVIVEVMPDLSNLEQPIVPPGSLDTDAIPDVTLVSDSVTRTVITALEESLQAGLRKGAAIAFDGYAASFKSVGDQETFYGGTDVENQQLIDFTLIGFTDDCEVYLDKSLHPDIYQYYWNDRQNIIDDFQEIVDMLTDPSNDLYISSLWYWGIDEPYKLLLYDMPPEGNGLVTGGFYNPNEYTGLYTVNPNYDGNDGLFLHLNAGDVGTNAGYWLYRDDPVSWFGTVAHEFQHLLTFDDFYELYSQTGRAYYKSSSDPDFPTGNEAPQTTTWLNEGRSGLVDRVYANEMNESHLKGYLELGLLNPSFVNYKLTSVPTSRQWNTANSNISVLSYYGSTSLLLQDYYQYSAFSNANVSTNGLNATLSGNRVGYYYAMDAVGDNFNSSVSSGSSTFDDFFLLANLDIAVDNNFSNYNVINNAGHNAYTHMALGQDSLWEKRLEWGGPSSSFSGVTAVSPNSTINVSSGGTTYYSNLYLADPVGVGRDTALITIPANTRAHYYVIMPYETTNIDNDSDWANVGKIVGELTPGTTEVAVGSNNMFAVLVVNTNASVSESFSYEAIRTGTTLSVTNNILGQLVSGNPDSFSVTAAGTEAGQTYKAGIIDADGNAATGFTVSADSLATSDSVSFTVDYDGAGAPGAYRAVVTNTANDDDYGVSGEFAVFVKIELANPVDGDTAVSVDLDSIQLSFDGAVKTTGEGYVILNDLNNNEVYYASPEDATQPIAISSFRSDNYASLVLEYQGSYEVQISGDLVEAFGARNSELNLGQFTIDQKNTPEQEVRPDSLTVAVGDTARLLVYVGDDAEGFTVASDSDSIEFSPEALDGDGVVEVTGKSAGNAVLTIGFSSSDPDVELEDITVSVSVTSNVTPPPTRPSGGGGSGRSSTPAASRPDHVTASSGGAVVVPDAEGIRWIDAAGAQPYVSTATSENSAYVRIRDSRAFGLRQAALLLLEGFRGEFDSVTDGVVQVRVTLLAPEKVEKDLIVSGAVKGAQVDKVKATFQRWFDNDLQVIHLDQAGEWGQVATIAALVDLSGMDTDNLAFYSYDAETYLYKRIQNVSYRIDANGYLVFTTDLAGDIVVSSGSLAKEAVEEPAQDAAEEPDTAANTAAE